MNMKIQVLIFLSALWAVPHLFGEVKLEIPYTVSPPEIQGKLNLSNWQKSGKICRLYPPTNKTADERWEKAATEIRLLWDEKFLYVLFLCRDESVFAVPAKRDDSKLYLQDVCEIFLDPAGDSRSYWEFQLNSRNVLFDQLIQLPGPPEHGADGRLTDDFFLNRVKRDAGKDMPGLVTDTGKTDNGWFSRWAIPATALLGHNFTDGVRLRAQFCRYDYQSGEQIFSYWTKILNGCPHTMPGHMGTLQLKKRDKQWVLYEPAK